MEIRYQRNHKESYMIMERDVGWNCYEEHMLRQNQISSLLSFCTMEVNGKIQFWYDITGKESLKDYLERELSWERLEKVMSYIGFAYEELQKYLVCQEHVWLSPETVYITGRNQPFAVYLCYYPGKNKKITEQLQDVMQYLISIVDHKQEPLADMCYTLYDCAVGGQCGFDELMDILYRGRMAQEGHVKSECGEESLAGASTESAQQAYEPDLLSADEMGERPDMEKREMDHIFEEMLSAFQKKSKRFLQMVLSRMFQKTERTEGEDFVFEPLHEVIQPTTLLYSGEENCVGRLVYDGEDKEDSFLITQEIFRIGSSDENDACIHTLTVSRRHARITVRQNEYYLEDLNSTNGTYVNDVVLNYNEPICLHAMDHVRFADVPYIFL